MILAWRPKRATLGSNAAGQMTVYQGSPYDTGGFVTFNDTATQALTIDELGRLAGDEFGIIGFDATYTGSLTINENTSAVVDISVPLGTTEDPLASLSVTGEWTYIGGLFGSEITTSTTQTYNSAVFVRFNSSLLSQGAGSLGNITFESTIEGDQRNWAGLTVQTDGTTAFDGLVGSVEPLYSLNTLGLTTPSTGTTHLNSTAITTTGSQEYENAVLLSSDADLLSQETGDITFGSSIDGAHNLTAQTDGTTAFDGRVGGTTPLQSLTTLGLTTPGTGTTDLNSTAVTTLGAQEYENAVLLTSDEQLLSQTAGNITFTSSIDGPYNLSVQTDGTTGFDGRVGGIAPLQSLTTSGVTTPATGFTNLENSTGVSTTGLQDYENTIIGNSNISQATAAAIGVGPGIHITRTLIYSGDNDWYSFQLLRTDSLDVSLNYASSQGGLGLELRDAAGNLITSNSSPQDSQLAQTGMLPAGTYYVHVYGVAGGTNTYSLAIDPGTKAGSVSTTRVLYVNDGSTADDFYSTAPGNDSNDGLTPQTPKATLQSLLAAYTLGPDDLVLVDTGTYGGGTIQIAAASKGAVYAGSPGGTTLNTGFQLTDADYDVIDGFNFAGFGGPGISAVPSAVNDSTNNTFLDNTFTGLSTAITITNGSSDVVEQNTFSDTSTAIALNGTGDETVQDNNITAAYFGIYMSGSGNALVAGNTVTGTTFAVYDPDGANLTADDNTLSGGDYGLFLGYSASSAQIYSNVVSGFTAGGIYVGPSATIYNNQVSTSGIGIYSGSASSIYSNQVNDNTVGIDGYGTIGGSDWSDPNDVFDNQTGISVYGASTVAFNSIYDNVLGIDLHDTTSVHNNLIYRNSGQGILVDGAHDLSILNNTIYTPSGDAVRIQGAAYNITLQNNILWTNSGYDLYVATDSQQGFSSDYNNLYTTGSGILVWWQEDFTDLFDWQAESGYDTHSIGYTSLAPTLDNPQFVNLAGDDYHLTNQTSTSIAAGNPASGFSQQPAQSGGRIELGAYGNTPQAAISRPSFIAIQYPNFFTDWQVNVGHAIQWQAYNVTGNVEIDLYEQGVGKVATIGTVDVGNGVSNPAGAAVINGSLGWSPAASGITGSTSNRYWIQISSTSNSSIETASREKFAIPSPSTDYYVNDGSLVGDQWSTAVGDDRNTGTTPGDPVANLIPLLTNYALGPGTTVHIDTGNYIEVRNVVIGGSSTYGNGQGTTFTGPANGGVAQLNRANTNPGSTDVDVNAGSFVTLEYLTLTGAQVGLYVRNGSTNFKGINLTAADNTNDGIEVDSTATASQFSSLVAYDNGGDGISIQTPIASLSNSQAYGNSQVGIDLYNPGPALLENDAAYNNQTGISINNSSGITVIGDADLAGAGNLIYGNATGIYASGSVQVVGNTAYGNSLGIEVDGGAAATENVIHDNDTGIQLGNYYSSPGSASDNRVYHNSNIGICAYGNGNVLGNTVYSNSIGIVGQVKYYNPYSGQIANNLVYANSNEGIVLNTAGSGAQVTNNTVYQPSGDAVLVQGGSSNVLLRNNILWVETGFDLNVNADSETGFNSDYNDLYTTAIGQVASWQGTARPTLIDWEAATLLDQDSIFADPLFAGLATGANGNPGYVNLTNDGRADNFHLLSPYGYFTGSSAPVADLVTGKAELLPNSELSSTTTPAYSGPMSPAIDRGDPSYSYANEPAPNGGFINLGSDGNTPLASVSPGQYVLVTRPGGGQSWPEGQTFTISWRSQDTLGTVDIDLVEQSDPSVDIPIAVGVANSGSYSWAIPTTITPAADYGIKVTRDDDAASGTSQPFAVGPPVHIYYVNPGVIIPGDNATNPGNDANDGLSWASPKASISGVLNSYTLGPGDIIEVDDGTYDLSTNIVIPSQDNGFSIVGVGSAILNRGSTLSSSDVIQLAGASNVTLENLQLTGGYAGIGGTGSSGLTVTGSQIYGNSNAGVQLNGSNTGVELTDNDIYNDGEYGVYLDGANDIVSGNMVTGGEYQEYGVYVDGPHYSISGNTVSGVYYGIYSYYGGTISGNTVSGSSNTGITAYGDGEPVTVSGNTVYANQTGIYADDYDAETPDVLVTDNTAYGNSLGIEADSGATATENVVHDNSTGIQLGSYYGSPGSASDNRVYHNSNIGIFAYGNGNVLGNTVYSNSIGIAGQVKYYNYYNGQIANNLVYANSNEGIELNSASSGAQIINNTVYQPVGDAVLVQGGSSNVLLRNNILWVEAGYDLNVNADSETGFNSDYNDLYTTASGQVASWQGTSFATQAAWFYGVNQDAHSQSVDPQFADPAGVDGVLGDPSGVDGGADDNFHVLSTSLTIDAGDPTFAYLAEPSPNGDRVNQGADGNTAQAATSAAQTIQVLAPFGLEKVQVGQTVPISWQTSGLTASSPVALIDAGGGAVGDWVSGGGYQTSGEYYSSSFSNPVNTSGVTNPAPQAVYQGYASANYGVGNTLSYSLPVPDGTYTVRLHFADDSSNGPDERVFDIDLQGSTVESGYDIFAAAGAANTATTQTFTVTVTGGQGIQLSLVNDSSIYNLPAILSGIEVTAANPLGTAAPTVSLQSSIDNGATWTTIASGLALDANGNGTYNWTPTQASSGNTALIRVVADSNNQIQGTSAKFLVAPISQNFYVNANPTSGGFFTTAGGNDANSGTSPDQPMADLTALFNAYTFGPGDVIHVDSGTYNLLQNVVIPAQDSGVTIEGPSDGSAILNRGSTLSSSDVIQLAGASNVTLENLQLTGGYAGIGGTGSSGLTVTGSQIYGNSNAGVQLNGSNTGVELTDNDIYNDGEYGVYLDGANDIVSGNMVTGGEYQEYGVYVDGPHYSISGNTVSGVYYGIYSYYGGTISGNTVSGSSNTGITAYGDGEPVTVSGNTVYANQTGIYADDYDAETPDVLVTDNTAYGNSLGIEADSGATATENVVHDNSTGIQLGSYYGSPGSASDNRVYHNSNIGIFAYGNGNVLGNTVYSNSIGIAGQVKYYNYYNGQIANNLVYANSNEGIELNSASSGAQIINNTVYQPVGDAVLVQGGSSNVLLRNNILWVEAGYDLNVNADSETGFNSDYNLVYIGSLAGNGTDPNAHVGLWGGGGSNTVANSLSAWQGASSGDLDSRFGNPNFVNPAGADNVLGYSTQGVGYNGGLDDNFQLSGDSPAIDAGDSWDAPPTDILGNSRVADPGSPNYGQGAPNYVASTTSQSVFSGTPGGVAQGWQGIDTYWTLNLPFAFSFYGVSYNSVKVSSSGFLQFAGNDYAGDTANSDAKLLADARIAPLWADLSTNGPGNDIFIDTSIANQVTIRWDATDQADGSQVNVAVTLFSDGSVRFDYGAGNTNLTPTVGISSGNGQGYSSYSLSSYDGHANLTNATSLLYSLQPGIVDIGAYEFQGSSLDTTPPTVTSATPTFINTGTISNTTTSQINLSFSKPLDSIDANAPATYELIQDTNHDGVFGDPGDTTFAVTPTYIPGATTATLAIAGGNLPDGTYQLEVVGSSLHDVSGNELDGSGTGVPGSDYVRTFTIETSPAHIGVTGNANTFTLGGSAVAVDSGISVTSSDTDITGASMTITNYHSGDSLNYTPIDGITIASNSGGVLTLTGSATPTQYQAALQSVTFSTTSFNQTARTINVVILEGALASNTGVDTVNVAITAPVVTANQAAKASTAGQTVAVDSAVTVKSFDTDVTGATMTIGTGYQSGSDTLHFTTQNGITGVYSAGVLTLSGSATPAQYQTALQSVTFSSTSTSVATRNISIVVDDSGDTGNVNSNTATTQITVSAPLTVTAAYISSSAWPSAFDTYLSTHTNAVTGHVYGSSTLGYAFQTGTSAAQTQTLPWTNLNTITVTFSGPVSGVALGSLKLNGGSGGSTPSVTGFTSDGSNTYSWTLSGPLTNNKYAFGIASTSSSYGPAVVDSHGAGISGTFTTGQALPSGNGLAGSSFDFFFDVLPGDANRDGQDNATDINDIRPLASGTRTTSSSYNPYYDLLGAGQINATTLNTVRALTGRLESAAPTNPNSTQGVGTTGFVGLELGAQETGSSSSSSSPSTVSNVVSAPASTTTTTTTTTSTTESGSGGTSSTTGNRDHGRHAATDEAVSDFDLVDLYV